MKPEKKKQKVEVAEIDIEYEKLAGELADAIVQNLQDDYQSELEPFSLYEKRIKLNIYKNLNEFRTRFQDGYRVLLQEVKKEQAHKTL